MQASKLAIVTLVTAGTALGACSSGGGGGKVSLVQQRFAPCLSALGTSAADWTWKDLGPGKDADGDKVDAVQLASNDGTVPAFTVMVTKGDSALIWDQGTLPATSIFDMFESCMGTQASK